MFIVAQVEGRQLLSILEANTYILDWSLQSIEAIYEGYWYTEYTFCNQHDLALNIMHLTVTFYDIEIK